MAYPPTAGMVAQRCLLHLPMVGRWAPEPELVLAPLRGEPEPALLATMLAGGWAMGTGAWASAGVLLLADGWAGASATGVAPGWLT